MLFSSIVPQSTRGLCRSFLWLVPLATMACVSRRPPTMIPADAPLSEHRFEGSIAGFGNFDGVFTLVSDGSAARIQSVCDGPGALASKQATCRIRTFRVLRDPAGAPQRAYVVVERIRPTVAPATCPTREPVSVDVGTRCPSTSGANTVALSRHRGYVTVRPIE
ncbi:MAG: hypothetical protein IT357_02545 [Gemmatimonadaceae bacterium]|nr:hypothetical protein [Gemmatimonadaceae bacterium]